MDAKEIEIVDIVYRAYYNAYKKNQMIGVFDVARQHQLTIEQVKTAILFLEGENQIKCNNKGFDPINSGPVYTLTPQGFSWFAKTCYVDELVNKRITPKETITNHIYGGNNQIGNNNNSQVNNEPDKKENLFAKYSKEIIIGVIITLIGGFLLKYFGQV